MVTPFALTQPLTNDLINTLVINKDTLYAVTLSGDTVELTGNWLLVNLILLKPLLRRNLPVDKTRHLFHNEDYTDKVKIRIHSEVYQDILLHCPQDKDVARFEFLESVQMLTNVIVTKLGRYHRSISIIEIADTLANETFAKAINIDITQERKRGIKAVQDKYKQGYTEVLRVMTDPQYEPNIFFPLLKLGVLNEAQFPRMVAAGGTRTDVDDTMINLPIASPYVKGLSNIMEYAIDSLTAKKSIVYNAREMPMTQYTNRKQQLLACCLRRIYPGDCGSSVTVNFTIHKPHARQVMGKNILDHGRLTTLTEHNIHHYFDKMVSMRSVLACRHTDGFCQACGGSLTSYLPSGVVPGIAAAIEVMSPIAQLVLSNKHVSTTKATTYEVPIDLKEWLFCMQNEVFIRRYTQYKSLVLGVPYADVERLSDLQYVMPGTRLPTQHFSSITKMIVADATDFKPLTSEIHMIDRNKSTPFFSTDFLRMVQTHPECVQTIGNMVWIKLDHFDANNPVMSCSAINDSTLLFVRRIEMMFSHRIIKYKTLDSILREFSAIIWDRTSPHLMHLETMLRASMVTSETDYRIPVVSDPNAVMFERLGRIIPHRSIGAQLAFERFSEYVSEASSYVFPKPESNFDAYLSYTDTI